MGTFLFRCPNTGLLVQGRSESENTKIDTAFETITCAACQGVHLVNPKTGSVVGNDDEP